jgi:hypothetical protein
MGGRAGFAGIWSWAARRPLEFGERDHPSALLGSDQMCLAGRKVHDERDEAKEEETLDDPRER